jgi:hypothetical protein
VDQDFETKKLCGILMSGSKYILPIALLYFLVSLCGIFHHELWLDESHHWLLSRDSETLSALFHNTRYEGHPLLWNILLFGITRITANPFWMQLLHIMIATTAVVVFLRKSPFPTIFKVLFIFGYFMVFEYSLISRNYSLGVLFLFLACGQFRTRRHGFVLLCCFLALACNTHLMFAVIASALFLVAVLEHFENKTMFPPAHLAGYAIFILGLAIVAWQILPPADTKFFTHIDIPFWDKFTKGFMALFKGLIVIPDFTTIHFWNSNLIVNLSKPLAAAFGLLTFLMPLVLYKSRKALLFVYVALLGMQVFFFVTQRGATRFDGMAYLIIIAGLWIDQYSKDEMRAGIIDTARKLFQKPVIYAILLLHLAAGVYAYAMDFRHPFTASKETAGYLKDQHLDVATLISVSCDGTALDSYLGKKMWFLCNDSFESYCDWDLSCATDISQEEIARLLSQYMNNHPYAVYVSQYLLVNDPVPNVWIPYGDGLKIRFRKKFGQTIQRNTGYYIFEISKLP